MANNELTHYGILGMKWGIRRSPEQLGKRKGVSRNEDNAQDKKSVNSLSKSIKKKRVRDLTDEELRNVINRLELEKRYADLAKSVNPPKSTRGRDFTLRVMGKIGENVLVNIGTQAGNKGLGVLINKAFNVDSADTVKRIVNPNKGQTDKK